MKLLKNQKKFPLTKKESLDFLEAILLPRMIEEKMINLLRQGKVSKWFSGIGQEAISVGVCKALKDNEYILPMHRNLGVFTTRDVDLTRLFRQFQGKKDGFTKGRDRSFHFGTKENKIIGMISHLGPQMGVACGIALAEKIRGTNRLSAVFTGEGGSSEGDFHEALNIASTWNLPILFIIENNGYGLSTPTSEQYNCKNLSDRGLGYGIESYTLDGNDYMQVYTKTKALAEKVRTDSRPILIEFKTFRIRGHEEASGQDYIDPQIIKNWEKKDPIESYIKSLYKKSYLAANQLNSIKNKIKTEIDNAWNEADKSPDITLLDKVSEKDVFSASITKQTSNNTAEKNEEMRFIDAISVSLEMAMERNDNLIIMGQDIAEYGGAFKVTKGFLKKFGKDRVRNTPICESGIIETAYGLGIQGIPSVVELQFADFVSSGFNPIVNLLAKSFFRWEQNVPIVLRMPCGGEVGAGPFHSQTNESWFLHCPGLKVVYPAFPGDAKDLLLASIEDPNPVLFYEHKKLYRKVHGAVNTAFKRIEIGKSNTLLEGTDLSIITYGLGVHWVLDLIEEMKVYSIELIDLRTLSPLDTDAIFKSVKKTGKVLILNEASRFMSFSAEIASQINENCFEYLDAPVMRVGSENTPIPFNSNLELNYLANSKLKEAIDKLMAY